MHHDITTIHGEAMMIEMICKIQTHSETETQLFGTSLTLAPQNYPQFHDDSSVQSAGPHKPNADSEIIMGQSDFSV